MVRKDYSTQGETITKQLLSSALLAGMLVSGCGANSGCTQEDAAAKAAEAAAAEAAKKAAAKKAAEEATARKVAEEVARVKAAEEAAAKADGAESGDDVVAAPDVSHLLR